jgi:glycosyltransferase involved in cell wall biosynthesis
MRNPRVKVLSLSRNFGKDTALSAGLDYAVGRAVIPIDSDLQDPPELIPQMVEKWREGYEVVYARRVSRDSDEASKRLTARLFYRFHNLIADVSIPQDTGDFRLLDRRVVEALKTLPERTRFMKGLFAWVGFRQTGIDYARAPRAAGETKWKLWKLWNFALDGITASSTLPLRIWTYFGLAVAVLAGCYGLFLVLYTLIAGADVPGYASIMITVLFLGAINIVATGILGEYVGRIHAEVRNRPLYLIREAHGIQPNANWTPQWTGTSTAASTNSKASTGGSPRAAAS